MSPCEVLRKIERCHQRKPVTLALSVARPVAVLPVPLAGRTSSAPSSSKVHVLPAAASPPGVHRTLTATTTRAPGGVRLAEPSSIPGSVIRSRCGELMDAKV